MSYEDILYEAVIGRREKKCRCPENELCLPFLNSKMRLTGEGERKWEEMRSELQWDPGPCGVLCTRIRTWDFAVPTKGSTAGCCGWSHGGHTSLSLSLSAKPSAARPQGLCPGCACCPAYPPSLSAEPFPIPLNAVSQGSWS